MFHRSTKSRQSLLTWLLLYACAVMASCLVLPAQQFPPAATDGYPVTVEGHEVLQVYEGIGNFSAQDRAQRTADKLRQLIRASDADIASITTVDEPYGTEIVMGDQVLLLVTDDDARQLHVTRALMATYYARQIRDTLNRVRNEHSNKFLLKAAAYGLATLAVYLLVIWLLLAGFRRLLQWLRAYRIPLAEGIKIQQSTILGGERITSVLVSIVRLLRAVLVFVLTWVFLATEFNYFPWTREHGRQLLAYITTPVQFVGRAFLNYLPNLFYILVIAAVMYYVMRFVRLLAREVERENIRIPGFYPEWAKPTYRILRFLLQAFTVVLVFPYLPGANSPAFKGVGLFLGVLFSLGSTSAVANVVAGTILTYTRGFRTGDWVKIGDNTGAIVAQTLLATHVRTIKNEEVTIPNSVVLSSHVINYSMLAQSDGLILHTSVTIGYDAPWRKVHQLLIEAALKTKYVLASPAPFVLQNALNDSYVQYEINAYTKQPLEMVYIYSDLHANIQDCFYAGGVEIMSPIYSAIRDGNKTAIPAEFLPRDYRPQGFRIAKSDSAAEGTGG